MRLGVLACCEERVAGERVSAARAVHGALSVGHGWAAPRVWQIE